jgi:hypothetical protein
MVVNMKMTPLDRILLLVTGLLAAYQIARGFEGLSILTAIAYTVALGILLIAGLLLIILGFEVLDSPVVVIAAGLVWQYIASFKILYLVFAIIGFMAVVLTRSIPMQNNLPTITIALVHGIAGMTIFLLPIILSIQGQTKPLFSLVGIGGALIGIGGLLLSYLKAGKPILPHETILKVLPGLLLLMTLCFVIGFRYG